MTEDSKKISPLTLLTGAGASVTAMILGSLLGDAGTIWGAATGSIVSGAAGIWYENKARKAHAWVKARKDLDRISDPELRERLRRDPAQTERFVAITAQRRLRRSWGPRRRLAVLAAVLAASLVSAAAVLFSVESATGQTLHSSFSGPPQHGTTIGGYTAQAPGPSPSRQALPPSPSASLSAPSGGTPAPSPPASVAGSPSANPSPDAAPDAPGGSGVPGSP